MELKTFKLPDLGEGLQEAEIASTLGIKVGTVKSSLFRGIERLRKELSDDQR